MLFDLFYFLVELFLVIFTVDHSHAEQPHHNDCASENHLVSEVADALLVSTGAADDRDEYDEHCQERNDLERFTLEHELPKTFLAENDQIFIIVALYSLDAHSEIDMLGCDFHFPMLIQCAMPIAFLAYSRSVVFQLGQHILNELIGTFSKSSSERPEK